MFAAVDVTPHLPTGRIGINYGAAAACDNFKITIHLIVPHLLDPFAIALVATRKLTTGTFCNIIADTVVLEGTVRSFSNETHALLKQEIAVVARYLAELHGGCPSLSRSMVIYGRSIINVAFAHRQRTIL